MITSVHNKHIKQIIALNEKRKERAKSGLFTAEGIKLFLEAPSELIERVFVTPSFEEENAGILSGLPYETVAESLFNKICDTKTPQGIITLLRQPVYERSALLSSNPFIVALEDVQDPGNVGTIMRTAEGAGASGILLSKGCADLFSPKTIRSTMGSVFRLPFIYEEDLCSSLLWLAENGVRSYGAHLDGSISYTKPDYKAASAIFIGNESKGLSPSLAEKCDMLVRIPMEGRLESLNVSVAAAVLMYCVYHKRHEEKFEHG